MSLDNLSGRTDIALEELEKMSLYELKQLVEFAGEEARYMFQFSWREELIQKIKDLLNDGSLTIKDILGE